MAPFSQEQIAKFIRGISVRQIRLGCGLVLFAYLVSHFLNHALGNISMDPIAAGAYSHAGFWQFLPVAIVFYPAPLAHTGLGIGALYDRRQFRWKAIEPLQLVLGLSIPALVITHLVGVRLGQTLFGHEKLYPQVFFAYWIVWPYKVWLMYAVLIIAWIHGCIGLYFWLRMKAFYQRAAPFLLAAAVLVPTLAMLGLYQGGRSVVDGDSVEWRAENLSPRQVGTPVEQAVLGRIEEYFLIGYLGLLGSGDPSCLSAQAGDRSVLLPDIPAAGHGGQLAHITSIPHRRGTLSGQHVRGHARLDQACGKTLAIRYGFHRQPLPRRGVAGRDRMRRTTDPVRRGRTIGTVRARYRPANRLPPGAQGGSHDRRQCRRTESVSQARSP